MYQPYSPIFFYDKFTEEDIAGLFTIEHFIYIAVIFATVAALLFLSRNISEPQFERLHICLAVAISVTEVVKIILNIYKGAPYDYFIPLYFCGLFNFAIWLAKSKCDPLRRIGFSYITLGGIFAGFFFTLYPSTALAHDPIYHPSTIHAAFFHGAMLYFGITALMRGFYKPKRSDIGLYFLFITSACFVALILNSTLGTNCMFLSNAFKLPLLTQLNEWFSPLYMIIAWLGQAYVLPILSLLVYNIIIKHQSKEHSI